MKVSTACMDPTGEAEQSRRNPSEASHAALTSSMAKFMNGAGVRPAAISSLAWLVNSSEMRSSHFEAAFHGNTWPERSEAWMHTDNMSCLSSAPLQD
eukprot:CAMPEP_0175326728 /NCGR_PEP_ID=MMETSP0093-20121207/74682_1 /TAXON_ID=311494 /ORGANISM="Alexandrium monilatum, Strain CCMP3105" /LENGTH=96 /DNA_ID=CAMNT_0016623741 /DNA_START=101 /DNA_END=390 /DNA_ORIENTATION=-